MKLASEKLIARAAVLEDVLCVNEYKCLEPCSSFGILDFTII